MSFPRRLVGNDVGLRGDAGSGTFVAMTHRRRAFVPLVLLLLTGCSTQRYCDESKHPDRCPPPAPREFRGVWVATVDNIDWPTRPGLPGNAQRREIISILDRAAALRLNAVILQVRPECDALYSSKREPWSRFLTGRQGDPPTTGYDPLQVWITEAHARGLELHAWFNPFRARQHASTQPASPNHVSRTHPEWVRTYGDSLWLDPGDPGARQHSLDVVLDVVKRYDVDGVHIDDYFYPYAVKDKAGKAVDFPDDPTWQKYQTAGGKLSRPDWRRDNINQFVHQLYDRIKHERKEVKFGISPFGIWKPGFPPQVKGLNAYESLYADSKKWLNEGWCDYFTPQLYWKVDSPGQPYEPLLKWWIGENPLRRHVWPGLYTSRVQPKGWEPKDIIDQITATRRTDGATGHVHFSAKVLMQARSNLDEALSALPYAEAALVPPSPWLAGERPAAPEFSVDGESGGAVRVTWRPAAFSPAPRLWGVYARFGTTWKFQPYPAATRYVTLGADPKLGVLNLVTVTAIDRLGNESRIVEPRPPREN